MPDSALLLIAFVAAVAGMGWLALTIDMNYARVRNRGTLTAALVTRLRMMGSLALIASLALCLAVDHASMAALVWVMMLATAALVITFTLAWRAHWLAVMVPPARQTQ